MKKLLLFCGAASVALFLCCGKAQAKVIVVSTSTPTNVLPTSFFGTKTVTLFAATTQQIFLNDSPLATTSTFVADSYAITLSSGLIIIPNFHGQIWAEAPNSAAAVNLFSMNGQ